jgi:hypothetical protein
MLTKAQMAPFGCTAPVRLSAIVTHRQLHLPVAAGAVSFTRGLHS